MRWVAGLALVLALTACVAETEQAEAQLPQPHLERPTAQEVEYSSLARRAEKSLREALANESAHQRDIEDYHVAMRELESFYESWGNEKIGSIYPSDFAKRRLALLEKIELKYGEGAIHSSRAQLSGLQKVYEERKTNFDQPAEATTDVREWRAAVQQLGVNGPILAGLEPMSCTGVPQQGGAVLCQTTPNAKVKVARSEKDFYFESANENGQIIIGFDRDERNNFVEVAGERVAFDLKPREYDTSRIDGLPPSQVSTFTESQLKRIRSSSARKKVGFSSRAKEMGFKNGFISPIKEYRKTTNFGAQRILNGEPKKPHYGVDMAAPVGTPIYAPADGVVSLADDDLYFEGAMVLLDHGQGLISMYLHTDEILVEPGQRVLQGEQIATVGSKGRSTGPHLCWRLKWRNRNLDPELLTEWPNDEH